MANLLASRMSLLLPVGFSGNNILWNTFWEMLDQVMCEGPISLQFFF